MLLGATSATMSKPSLIAGSPSASVTVKLQPGEFCTAGVRITAGFVVPGMTPIEAVTAVIVLKDGAALAEHEAIAHCAARLAHFKVPKRVIFADSLPKNPSGKVLKRELRRHYET